MARERDDHRELEALVDELVQQAGEVRRQWAELAEAVGAPSPDAQAPADAPREPQDDVLRMRLVALDMMLSGSTREQVSEHLRSTFAAEEVEDVIDDVFAQYGQES